MDVVKDILKGTVHTRKLKAFVACSIDGFIADENSISDSFLQSYCYQKLISSYIFEKESINVKVMCSYLPRSKSWLSNAANRTGSRHV